MKEKEREVEKGVGRGVLVVVRNAWLGRNGEKGRKKGEEIGFRRNSRMS